MSGSTQVLWRRALAHVLDGLAPFVLALAAGVAVAGVSNEDAGIVVFFVLFVGLSLAIPLVLQGLTGWTPGKWLLGIRVCARHGELPRPLGGLAA